MLVLAIEREQPGGQLSQFGQLDRAPAEVCACAPVSADASGQHDLVGSVRQLFADEAGGELEDTLDVGFAGPRTDYPGTSAAAEQEVEGVRQHRLAGAGLAGDHVEAAGELEAGVLDQQQVLDG